MSEALPVHQLYSRYLVNPEGNRLAESLWGTIPRDMAEAGAQMRKSKSDSGHPPERLEDLKKALKESMKALGILTEKAIYNIDNLDLGAAETGQQPNLLAGPSLILNKTAYTVALAKEGECVPMYFIGDYDGVQPELINGRLPSPGGRGVVFTYPVPVGYEGSPIRNLPNPSEEWLRKSLEKIEGNTRGLLKGVAPAKQEAVLENLSHISTIVRLAYYASDNVADWSSRILGTLFNVEANFGVVFFKPSVSKIRRLIAPGFERLLSEPNRSRFIYATNEAVNLIESNGYRAQIGKREKDYVPFFYECSKQYCHGNRVELKYSIEGSYAELRGKCSKCLEEYAFSVDVVNPDLSDLAESISPRVDSRQIAVSSVVPISAHVGGPGETSYHAEVMPGVRAIGLSFPVYIRYTRIYYNTPWNELQAETLKQKGYPTLIREELFNALSKWVEARKKGSVDLMDVAFDEIKTSVDSTYSVLESDEKRLVREIEHIKTKLVNPDTRQQLISIMKNKQSELGLIDTYLSSAYGRFAPEKYGQEVSWLWLDIALVSGVKNLMGAYTRLYVPNTPNSAVYFVNFS
jgi:uncharacterized protein YllA (UPF0747 family)